MQIFQILINFLVHIDCHDVWTVFNESIQKTFNHSFMVLAQPSQTVVSAFTLLKIYKIVR